MAILINTMEKTIMQYYYEYESRTSEILKLGLNRGQDTWGSDLLHDIIAIEPWHH